MHENKACVSGDDCVFIFDLMFKYKMRAYTFSGLSEVNRDVNDVWIKQANGLPAAASSMSGAVPERTLNILFAPALRTI